MKHHAGWLLALLVLVGCDGVPTYDSFLAACSKACNGRMLKYAMGSCECQPPEAVVQP